MPSSTLVWLRHGLRLRDHPAFVDAAEHGAVVPLFVWAPEEEGDWPPGDAAQWWLHHALRDLGERLRERGSRLILRTGPTSDALRAAAAEAGADRVVWNRRYEPHLARRDANVREALEEDGIETQVFESQILHDPEGVETTSGGPYHVFTPFWKKVRKENLLRTGTPLDVPDLPAPPTWPSSEPLDALGLATGVGDGARGIHEAWTPTVGGAHDRLDYTLEHVVADYDAARDRPDQDGTARLSPFLHHGHLSPRQVWHRVGTWADETGRHDDARPLLRQVVFREFAYHWLHHYPDTPTKTYRDKFRDFPWRDDADALARWKQGQTGYPIVDAGMRQLAETGWMHNRVRMIVASFLTKDLMIHWRHGARWFWDRLVDADLASNTFNWQWTAGCGADAQPFFRVFNPVSQSERHDPDGDYIRRYVPELADLPDDALHTPWEESDARLEAFGVTLGETYPRPMVDHSEAREDALAAYETVK
ncbi:MAG: deoxyribodipyrimidine photo-lyase [Salinibacter sp.]